MDLQTYDQATELLNKYRLCQTILEYLSDPDAVMGQKYKEQCGEFFKVFHDEMLVVTHDIMTKCGEAFSDLHCPEHTEQPETPTPPTDAKFHIGDRVKVIVDLEVLNDRIGTVTDFNTEGIEVKYGVQLDEAPENSLLWFTDYQMVPYVESELTACTEEEEPENPEEDGAGDIDPTEGE